MGGRKKPASSQPRVKDNLKPSSSEKSAQFLVNQTGSLGLPNTLFSSTYPAVANQGSGADRNVTVFVPLPQNPDAVGLNPELLSILKRIDKKDAITKQKALQDLCDALKKHDVFVDQTILAVLPFWPPIYARISGDSDRKVREWAQTAMNLLAGRVGRELGAYIKQILPTWALATVDSHEPAAELAKHGLSRTFPGSKQSEAYRLCAGPLLDLLEHLFIESLNEVVRLVEVKNCKNKREAQEWNSCVPQLDFESEAAFTRLACALRFTESLALELAALTKESRHLVRLRSFLSPENLWSRVSHVVGLRSGELSHPVLIGNSSVVHVALYKLSVALCSNPDWRDWLGYDVHGRHLAAYLCSSTVGQLGSADNRAPMMKCEKSEDKLILIPSPTTSSCSPYWDAMLTCLQNLPHNIVWSVVDWKSQLLPQLKIIISESCDALARQVYPNLLILLSKLPIDFSALTETDCALLSGLFIESLLAALERSLTPKPVNSDLIGESSVSLNSIIDPDLPVSIVVGLLECSRFLIDRLTSALSPNIDLDGSPASLLLNEVVHKVVLRLLTDALTAPHPETTVRLVCTQPTYLQAVFSNVACLWSKLGRSENAVIRGVILELMINRVVCWISEDLPPTLADHHADPVENFRIGLLNPLRLLQFIDALAIADSSSKSLVPMHALQRKQLNSLAPSSELTSTTEFLTVRSKWCIQMLLQTAAQLESKLTSNGFVNTPHHSLLYILLLCFNGYLPTEHLYCIPDFENRLFTVILSGLSEDLSAVCISRSVVEGAARLWSTEPTHAPLPSPSDTICRTFLDHFFPILLTSEYLELLMPRISVILVNWFTAWLHQLLHDDSLDPSSPSFLNITSLLRAVMNPKYTKACGIRELMYGLLQAMDDCGCKRVTDALSAAFSHPVALVTVFYSWTRLLEAVAQCSSGAIDGEMFSRWLFQLARLLFAAYTIRHAHAAIPVHLAGDEFSNHCVLDKLLSDPVLLTDIIGRAERLLVSGLEKRASSCQSKELMTLVSNLLLDTVIYLKYVPVALVGFAERITSPATLPGMAVMWLEKLKELIHAIFRSVAPKFGCPSLPSRCVLSSFGSWSIWTFLAPAIRLHQLGLRLRLPRELQCNDTHVRTYRICLGLLRACLSHPSEPFDFCSDIGWPFLAGLDNEMSDSSGSYEHQSVPAKYSFTQVCDRLAADYGRLWFEATSDVSLTELLGLLANKKEFSFKNDPVASDFLHSMWNAVLFNRFRSIHPNSWPLDFLQAASCTDEPSSSCWTERFLLSSFKVFRQSCELFLPAGVVRRCLSRQELLARFMSLLAPPGCNSDLIGSWECKYEPVARVLESCVSLVSIRSVAPIYVSTFLSIFIEDCKNLLTDFGDLSGNDDSLLWKEPSVFRICLSCMSFLETLLLLWQPWQWASVNDTSDKFLASKQLGLIQLSLRLQQLRPSLSQSQWDFLLCTITSWVGLATEEIVRGSVGQNMRSLFAFRAFRLAAALGSMFVDKSMSPISLESLLNSLHSQASNSTGSVIDEPDGDIDPEADEIDLDTGMLMEESAGEDGITQSGEKASLDIAEDVMDEEVELDDCTIDDMDDELSICSGKIIFPRRGRLPVTLRTDWDGFFSLHLFSSLLSALFKSGLLLNCVDDETDGTERCHLQSFCAAFATCPASLLIRMLDNQRQLVFEYLFDSDTSISTSPPIKQLVQSRAGSWNDLSLGLRASILLALRLIHHSRYQCGQLLGHILLTRVVCARTQRSGSAKVLSLSNHLVHRLPTLWISLLNGPLPKILEDDVSCENALEYWGRGSRTFSYLMNFTTTGGWALNSDAHQKILSYLLAWDAFLSFFTCTGPQARSRIQRSLLGPSAVLFDRLILTLGLLLPPPGNVDVLSLIPCRLEPEERLLLPVSARRTDLIAALTSLTSSRQRRPMRLHVPLSSGDDKEWRDAFEPDDALLWLPERRLVRDIGHLSVRLFRRLLAEAPALFRSWFNRLTVPSAESFPDSAPIPGPLSRHKPGRLRQMSNVIDNLVSRHFSSQLARDEVVLVHYKAHLRKYKDTTTTSGSWFNFLKGSGEVGSISIRSHPLSREVVATYRATEEHSIEMFVQLPPNYPLGLTTVTCGRGIPANMQQWNVWSVQLSVFINNQNGSILDGIDLWQRNARKKFEGVEECAICYSVVHNTNFSLPKMQCHTCRKLFHYACMYRWFTTSRNPVCPLCRNLFFGPYARTA